MSTEKNATLLKELEQLKNKVEKATGRKFDVRKDSKSAVEDDKGQRFSYLFEMGNGGKDDLGSAKTRLQVWLTTRATKGAYIDCYVGSDWIKQGIIITDDIASYKKNNDYGCGGSYYHVSLNDLIKFFDTNDLIVKKQTKKRTSKAEVKTA
jgi:hypothetical protein